MRINKLLVPLAFSMLFSSGTAVAYEDVVDKAYRCLPDKWTERLVDSTEKDQAFIEVVMSMYINFMTDGGYIIEQIGARYETYRPITVRSTFSQHETYTASLVYTDLVELHQFVVNMDHPKKKPSTLKIILDKDLMLGTFSETSQTYDGPMRTTKEGFGCEQVYPIIKKEG